jgi:ligand-binding sensor domain-containing protein/serine phosphatase RsbU (regulator of sigma subunit)
MKRTLLLLFLGLLVRGANVSSQEIPAIHYAMKDGLGGSSVAGIYQDRQGHIWMVTLGGGLSRFDGRQFTTYGMKHGLEVELTRAIVESSEGEKYVGTFGAGVYQLQKDTLIRVFADTLPKEIFSMASDKKGAVYVGGDNGLYKLLPNNQLINLTAKLDLLPGPVTHVSIDRKGDVWFNYDEFMGVYHLSADTLFHHYDSLSGITSGRILSTFHDRSNTTWVSTHQGIYRIDKKTQACQKITAHGLPNYYVFDIIELPSGELVMGTQDRGVVFYNPSINQVTRTYDSNKGLNNQIAFKLLLDRENNVWVSSWGEGVSRLLLSGWEKYSEGSGMDARLIYAIKPYAKSWLVASPNGLYTLDENKRAQPFLRNKFNESIFALHSKDELLFCAKERSLEVTDLKTEKTVTYTLPFLQGIKSITEDRKGTVYFVSWGGGISTFENGQFASVDDSLAQTIGYLYCAYTDTKGMVWMGSWEAGLIKYDGQSWSRFTDENGLPSNKVTSITEDSKGRIIAGTNGGGVAIIEGENVILLNSSTVGLPNNSVFALYCDKNEVLWMGFQGSIGSFDLKSNQLTIYDATDGFDGDVMLNAILASEEGLWVGTNNFLWHFDAAKAVQNQLSLQVFLNNIFVNGIAVQEKNEFKYYENKLFFSFYSTQMYRADEVRFSYRVVGIEDEFSVPSSQTEISLLELPYGVYTFEVKACLDDTCGEVVRYSFTIHPPFWKTWWFIGLMVGCSVGLIWLYIKWREKALKETQRKLEDTVTLRTKEIAHQKEIVEERNKEITDSINYAKRLQDAILPPTKLWFNALPDSFVLYLPKDIVAGDFYWLHTIEENHQRNILFAAADCTGHGVPGAMVSVVCSNALNRAVKEFGLTTPDTILNKVRDLVIETFEKSENKVLDGMDISLAALIESDSCMPSVMWSGANNPLWIIRKGAQDVEEIKPDKQPVGNYGEQKPFTLHNLDVASGDAVYLFSDGYQDQFGGEKGKKFKSAELKKLLVDISDKKMYEQQIIIQEVFERWRGTLEQVDDVCIIGVRIKEE